MNRMMCVLLLSIVFTNCTIREKGNMGEVKQNYKVIFRHSTNSNFYIADMSNTYSINNEQTIDMWVDRNAPFTFERQHERIVRLLKYDQIAIQISMYWTRIPGKGTKDFVVYDICFNDIDGNSMKINLCVNERNGSLAFAKIIDNTLCIGLYEDVENSYPVKIDFTNLYTIKLDQEDYHIIEYKHNLGAIKNIWIQNDGKMQYTTYNDNKMESGIVNISNENELELIELFNYSIVEYHKNTNQMIGFDSNKQLFYRDSGQNIHFLDNVRGNVDQAFFFESDKIIIRSYIEKDNIIANFLFGGKNTDKVYSYYILYLSNKDGFSVKKINTFNQFWRLEQITRQ